MENIDDMVGKFMKKAYPFILLLAFVLVFIVCLFKITYSEKYVIGLTSDEVIKQYGAFDQASPPNADGVYRNCNCKYIVYRRGSGFWGKLYNKYFYIRFDENGVAESCWFVEDRT